MPCPDPKPPFPSPQHPAASPGPQDLGWALGWPVRVYTHIHVLSQHHCCPAGRGAGVCESEWREQGGRRGPCAACPPLAHPCSLRVTVNAVFLIGLTELLQLREEGLGLAADGRAVVQRPWRGQRDPGSCCVATGQGSEDTQRWHRRAPALPPPGLVRTWKVPATHYDCCFCLSVCLP